MQESETTWRWPRVVGKVEHGPTNPLEYAKLWGMAQARAGSGKPEVSGLDDVELWIHTCSGNPNLQRVYSGDSYRNSIEIYLERLHWDMWTVEATCGFGRQGFNRLVAFYKTTAIAQARNILLGELGLEERSVAAADPALQTDVRPDFEPLTHLPPRR